MAGSESLWDRLKDTVDTFSSQVILRKIPTGGESTGGGSDITMDIRGTLTCATWSRKSTQESKMYDYFLLSKSYFGRTTTVLTIF